MPSPRLWSSRRPLYRLNLAVLLTLTPFNLLGMLLPYWLKTTAAMTSAEQGRVTVKEVSVQYGIWRQCSDVTGCRWIYDHDYLDPDVGAWMVPIAIFMVLSTLCQLTSAVLGASQNFLPRDFSRHVRLKVLRRVLHRDCPYTEDVGFLAGFFGSMSCIIFMLGTKDQISDGAQYQWAFAFAFISSTLTVMATLTLTKTHLMTAPRPPHRRRPGSSPRSPEVSRDGGASSSYQPQPPGAVRTEDARLEEGRGAEGRSSSRRTEPRARSSRSRRSSSGSRERSGQSRSRQERPASSSVSQSRLVRSPELEDIPAAVAPAAQGSSGGAPRRGSRNAPIMCLQMSDLPSSSATSRTTDSAGAAVSGKRLSASGGAASGGAASGGAASVSGSRGREEHRTSNGKAPKGSRTQETSFHSSEPDRTQPEDVVVEVVVTPSGGNSASAQG